MGILQAPFNRGTLSGSYPRPANYGVRLTPDGETVQGKLTVSFGSCNSGSISGSILTVTGSFGAGTLAGAFAVGQTVYVNGASTGCTIASLGAGTGGTGTYNLSGAPGDVSGAAISASTNVISITNADFSAGDTGKSIRFQGLGANGRDLITTIASVTNATTIALTDAPESVLISQSGGATFATITYGTDNSTAIKLAHDAAVSAGSRNLWIDSGVYWAGNLNAAGNVIYVGENASFVGTRRYRVQSPTRRAPYMTRQTLNPTAHLAKFQAQSTVRVAHVGDSISTPQFVGNASIYLSQEVKKALHRANPGKTIQHFNFSIGGCTMSDFASASEINFAGRGLSKPSWWSTGHNWMYQIQNVAWGASTPPHTVFIELGTNVNGPIGNETAALYSVISQLQALSTTPDIILFTPGVASLMSSDWWDDSVQERWEQIGAFWRGFALRNGLGYIDIGRHARMLRDGFDIVAEDIPASTTPDLIGTQQLPLTLPLTRDFAINWNMTINNAQWIATGSTLDIKLGDSLAPAYATLFRIGRTAGGNFAVSLYQQGYGTVFGPIDTGVAVPTSGSIYFELLVRDSYVRLGAANNFPGAVGIMPTIWEGEVERMRSPFTPTVAYSNKVSTTLITSQVCLSTEQPVMPNMIDFDMFIPSSPSVHPSTGGQVQLYRQALEQERFA